MDNEALDDLETALADAVLFLEESKAQAWIRESPESKWRKIRLPHMEDNI